MTSIKDEWQYQQSSKPVHANSSSKRSSHGNMTEKESHQLVQMCTQVLNYLMSFEIASPFIMPVPQHYHIYYSKVEQPMDLTTLESNLLSQEYISYRQFEVHLSLIWRNAMEYYQQHTTIYKKATMLQQLYDVFKKDLDPSVRSVTSIPVELPPQQSEPESDKNDVYVVVAVSPQEPPLMVQHYENFAYARPTYDELHGPLFHQLIDEPGPSTKKRPYPRLYISRNRMYLTEALERQASSSFMILWNTRFEAPQRNKHQNLLIMTTNVTHGIPYQGSHNVMRSPSSYLASTPAGVSSTSDSDYAPQAWVKYQPTRTFYNVKMAISERMIDAFFSRAYAIQPVSAKIEPPVIYPTKQPWVNNPSDVLLIERMKQCLKLGESDTSILDEHRPSATQWNTGGRQQDEAMVTDTQQQSDEPIVISDDDDIMDDHATPTTPLSATREGSPELTQGSGIHPGHDTVPKITIPAMASPVAAKDKHDRMNHGVTPIPSIATSPVIANDNSNNLDMSVAPGISTKAMAPVAANDNPHDIAPTTSLSAIDDEPLLDTNDSDASLAHDMPSTTSAPAMKTMPSVESNSDDVDHDMPSTTSAPATKTMLFGESNSDAVDHDMPSPTSAPATKTMLFGESNSDAVDHDMPSTTSAPATKTMLFGESNSDAVDHDMPSPTSAPPTKTMPSGESNSDGVDHDMVSTSSAPPTKTMTSGESNSDDVDHDMTSTTSAPTTKTMPSGASNSDDVDHDMASTSSSPTTKTMTSGASNSDNVDHDMASTSSSPATIATHRVANDSHNDLNHGMTPVSPAPTTKPMSVILEKVSDRNMDHGMTSSTTEATSAVLEKDDGDSIDISITKDTSSVLEKDDDGNIYYDTTSGTSKSTTKVTSPVLEKDDNDSVDRDMTLSADISITKDTSSVLEKDDDGNIYYDTTSGTSKSTTKVTSPVLEKDDNDSVDHDMTLSADISITKDTSSILENDDDDSIYYDTTSDTSPVSEKDDDDGGTTPDVSVAAMEMTSLEPADSDEETEQDRNTSTALLEMINKMKEYACSKGVNMANANDYMSRTAPKADVESHFKSVYFVKDNKALVVLLFRRMTTMQCVNEIVSLLKVKGQEGMGNIIDILHADGDENNVIGFTMERYRYTLKHYLQVTHDHHQLTPHQKMDLIRQMLKCLECIHENGIAHRDLSEGNFMVDLMPENADRLADGSIGAQVRLIDFGRSVLTKSDDVRRWWVEQIPGGDDGEMAAIDARPTEACMAPKTQAELDEWCARLPMIPTFPDHNHRSFRSIQTLPRTQKDFAKLPWLINPMAEDVYSVGVLIWRVFTDKVPWNGVMERNLADLHVMMKDDAAIELQVGRGVSGDLSQLFLLKCLRAEHGKRLSAKGLLAQLDIPRIAQGMLEEWATFYSSTATRSLRTAAATRFQNEQARSSLPKVLRKRKQKQNKILKTSKLLKTGMQRTRSKRLLEKTGSKHAQSSTESSSQSNAKKVARNSSLSRSTMETRQRSQRSTESPPSTSTVKTRTQARRMALARSASPHSNLTPPTTTTSKHTASMPSSPKSTVHTTLPFSSSPRCLPSTPPSDPSSCDEHQEQPSESPFFTTNVAKNPYLYLISYPPSNIRSQKRTALNTQSVLPFTQQQLNWMYDAGHNLKLPLHGLTRDGSPSTSSIFGESDGELTPAPATDCSQSLSPAPIASASPNEGNQKTYDDHLHNDDNDDSIEDSETNIQPQSIGSKRRSSLIRIEDGGSNMTDSARKRKHTTTANESPGPSNVQMELDDDNGEDTHSSTSNNSESTLSDSDDESSSSGGMEYYSDDDKDNSGDSNVDDDENDDDYMAPKNAAKKRGRPLGTKSRRGSKPLGRPPGRSKNHWIK